MLPVYIHSAQLHRLHVSTLTKLNALRPTCILAPPSADSQLKSYFYTPVCFTSCMSARSQRWWMAHFAFGTSLSQHECYHRLHVSTLTKLVNVLRPTKYVSRSVDNCTLLNPVCSSNHTSPATLPRGHCCTHSLCNPEYLQWPHRHTQSSAQAQLRPIICLARTHQERSKHQPVTTGMLRNTELQYQCCCPYRLKDTLQIMCAACQVPLTEHVRRPHQNQACSTLTSSAVA